MKKYLTILSISVILILLTACGKNTYEIDKEIRVDFEGYDEYGKAQVHVDKDGLFSALNEIMKLKDRSEVVEFESLLSDLDVQVTPNENVKNGDKVDLELTYDEDNSLKLDLKLKNPKVTVEDLEPIKALSKEEIFAGIDIQYEGISPFLSAKVIENSSSEVSSLFNYSIPEQRFKIDEEIQVTAEPKSDLLASGYKADEQDFTNSIKVSSKEKYVEKWDELNEDDQKYILGEIQDLVTAKIDSEIQKGMNAILDKGKNVATGRSVEKNEQSKMDEQYFLFAKEREFENTTFDANKAPNEVRFLYKNKVTLGEVLFNQDYSDKTKDYFSLVGASNLILDENDDLVRSELNVKKLGKTDLDKETVKNENLYNMKDKFTMDEFEIASEE
ncbi:hypothetical protein J14TS2_28510 [Bacillus sp. J14TS2]|uniref:hypothetical protein n=1 Tax=Bacillus sp. J14TS2 TaxID=2807188 RepID=UPI001B06F2EE|nr:hypothetical protein [Bacillus sp. J14TS2]GIN72376.1 hypothetical protein J14TS2_28510 [Bacillus sp. J14TS2]